MQGKHAAYRRPNAASSSSSPTSPTVVASRYWSFSANGSVQFSSGITFYDCTKTLTIHTIKSTWWTVHPTVYCPPQSTWSLVDCVVWWTEDTTGLSPQCTTQTPRSSPSSAIKYRTQPHGRRSPSPTRSACWRWHVVLREGSEPQE